MIDLFKHAREAQEHVDSFMRAARRGDYQAARAIARLAAVSVEEAVRALPDAQEEKR